MRTRVTIDFTDPVASSRSTEHIAALFRDWMAHGIIGISARQIDTIRVERYTESVSDRIIITGDSYYE